MSGQIRPHNERPAAVWSSGGRAYEEVSRQIASAIDHAAYRLAAVPGETILDLATGTGWGSRIVARQGATVTGADIAADLLATASARAKAEGLNINYQIGDAEALPFADANFDGVISTFGVMFASNQEAAAGELARVCRPGGRVVLATWTTDGAVAQMFQVMRAYMPPPPNPAPSSPFTWGARERVTALLGQAFDIRFEEGTAIYFGRSANEAWEAFVTGYGPTKMLAASLDVERRAALERDFIAFHAAYATDLGIAVPRKYLITHGTRRAE
jgi:ubiquinone/menaquinone biosynthesis C-methylase UbiE